MQLNKYLAVLLALTFFIVSCGPTVPSKDHPAYHNPAIRPLTEAIEVEPGNAANYFRRAEALSEMGLDSLALEDVHAALLLDKNNAQYNFTVGYLQLKMDKPGEAIKTLQQCLVQSPGNANVRLLLAKAYIAENNPAAAQEQVSKLLAAAPQHIPAQMIQAQIKVAQKDTAGAILAMKNIVAADPHNYDAAFQLADWYKATRNPEALALYQKVFELDTTNADALFEIGDFYEQQQQWNQAKQAYRVCLSNDMDYTDAYLRMGQLLLAQDSADKALRHFNLAINTHPNSAEGYTGKGASFEKLQQKDSAVAAYRQALIFDRASASAAEGLKRLKSSGK